jgi:osmotically inducible protein OsmC
MHRTANAVWKGSGRDGAGALTTQSGVLSSTNYGFKSRFEDGPGTNPEELLAAAHAGCFTMAVAFGLQQAGFTADELRTDCVITIEQDGAGFTITRSALTLRAKVPNIDEAKFKDVTQGAEKTCPLSKVIKAEITLDAALD